MLFISFCYFWLAELNTLREANFCDESQNKEDEDGTTNLILIIFIL